MESFVTELDSNEINIVVKPFSDALLDGPRKVRISIYNKDTPKKWRKVKVIESGSNTFKASLDKKRLQKRPIIKIKTHLIVDDLALKEQIASLATVEYTLDSKRFESTYQLDKKEYNLGKPIDETFSVIKRIEVSFS